MRVGGSIAEISAILWHADEGMCGGAELTIKARLRL